MSGNRWRVKHEWYPFDEPHRVWEVQTLVDGWWETVCHRMTWQAAQDEADRLSRTITLELQEVSGETVIQSARDDSFPLRVRTNWYGETVLDIGRPIMMCLTKKETFMLATDLLARYYQLKAQQ